jgi:hypothetical protein
LISWLCCQTEGEPVNSKLDLSLFQAGLRHGGIDADADEVECILANMIYKVGVASRSSIWLMFKQNYVKGYLSHAQQKIVLSQKTPFPPITAAQ